MASLSAALQRSTSLLPRRSLASLSTSKCNLPFKRNANTGRFVHRTSTFHQPPNNAHRYLSGIPSPLTGTGIVTEEPDNTPEATGQENALKLPTSLAPEAGLGAQDAMRLFIEYGIGKGGLEVIAQETKRGNVPFVDRWQKMIQIYLQTQCAVIQLLGYPPNEQGITLYTQHLAQAMQLSSPDVQEQLRTVSRDTYRMVLGGAFGINLVEEQKLKGEVSIVDARNMMHKVSLRMQEAEILEKVSRACSQQIAENDTPEAKSVELAYKHTRIQQIMVHDVYLSGSPSLVEECGFGRGEEGYVRMQSALADHQTDPLISQYVGGAMVKLLEAAGIDVGKLQRQ